MKKSKSVCRIVLSFSFLCRLYILRIFYNIIYIYLLVLLINMAENKHTQLKKKWITKEESLAVGSNFL